MIDLIKPGTRWNKGEGFKFYPEREIEDMERDPQQLTSEVIKEMMSSLTPNLRFTTEICSDFRDGWMPTLDCKLRVRSDGIIIHSYYEKTMINPKCLLKSAAISEQSKAGILAAELQRRMTAIHEKVSLEERIKVLDE